MHRILFYKSCTGTPSPDNTNSTASSVCPNANFTLSLQNNVLETGLTYQWQSSPDDTTWTNIQGDTTATLTTSQSVPAYYQCMVTCANSQSTVISNPIYITMNRPTSCYCVPPASINACIMWITNVTTSGGVSDFNNSSGCIASSYTDFSSSNIASNLQLATTTMSFSSYQNPMAFSVWIDFNDDGIFDPSEQVITNYNSGQTLMVTDSFTIPITAAIGTHRMRVRGEDYNDDAPYDPCNQLWYGETEDYSFTVTPSTFCDDTPNPGNTLSTLSSVCPNANFTLSLQNNPTASGITYQWYSSTDNIYYYDIQGAIYDTLTTSQTSATYYECLATCTYSQNTGVSNSTFVDMNAPTACYCIPPTSLEPCVAMWITNVTTSGGISDINNNSDCSSYSYTDYSGSFIVSNLQLATTFMSFSAYQNPMAFTVWIDYNDDGIFESNEMVIKNENSGDAFTVTDSFTIPLYIVPGTHRMRVRGEFYGDGAPTDPCSQLWYGETEDYSFTVIPAAPCTKTPNPGNTISTVSTICPGVSFVLSLQNNCAAGNITYQWQSSPDDSIWTNISGAIYDTLTASQTNSTYYRCSVTCATGPSTSISNPVYVMMNPNPLTCYCIPPTSWETCIMWISNVTTNGGVSDFTNNSGCSSTSYTNYSSSYIASNLQLTTTTMSLTSSGYPMAYSVWIDFNDDGVFETNEMVIKNGNSAGAFTVTDSFAVPLYVTPGTHRMRVRGEFYGFTTPTDPCSELWYGETEDYSFTVIPAAPCTETPNPGNTISTESIICPNVNFVLSLQNNCAAGSITYQWQSSPNNGTWTDISGAIYDTLTISQTNSSYYRCSVTCATGPSTGISNPVYVMMNPNPLTCYCIPPTSWETCIMWISNVTTNGGVSDFTNNSGCSSTSYTNYSSSYIASNLQLTTTTMSLTSSGYPMAYSVWIDFNDDGVFDATEMVITDSNAGGADTVTDSFTIPVTVAPGTHRMRVRAEYYEYGTPIYPCIELWYGETEDYAFTVIANPQSKTFNVTAMLQEYYISGNTTMNQAQDIDSNGDNFNKWSGSIVDTITVQIRSTIGPHYAIEQQFSGSYLNADGTFTLSGTIPSTITGYQYIVIKHWKSVETWSDSVDFTPTVVNYNFFTNPASTQFPTNMTNTDAYSDLVEGNLIWAGDITNGNDDILGEQDGYVTLDDVFLIYYANLNILSGYNELDINGDGYVTLDDVFLAYNNNLVIAQIVNPITLNSKKK